MTHFDYKNRRFRIDNVNGTLWGVLSCVHGNKSEDVARLSEFGEEQSRYIAAGFYGNWQCLLPGETSRDKYGYTYEGYQQPFTKAWQSVQGLFDTQTLSQADYNTILAKYPEFKWVIAKASFKSAASVLKIIDIWRQNSRMVETLLSMGMDYIALDRRFYAAKNPMEIVKYISKNPNAKYSDLENIRMAIKYGVDLETIGKYKNCIWRGHHVTFEEWRYLLKTDFVKHNNICKAINVYNDYKDMAKRAGHNLNENYWHYPKALAKQHNKVQKEVNAIIKAEQAIRAAKMAAEAAEKERKMQNVYTKFAAMMKPLESMETTNGIYTAYIPQDVATVKQQAEKLHQCLIANNYIGKVVKKECLLVFIAKNGKPFATAELTKRGKKYLLNQFYGNQQDDKDWTPKPTAYATLDLFIEKNKLPMIKKAA